MAEIEQEKSRLGGERARTDFTWEKWRKNPNMAATEEALLAFDPSKDNFYLWGGVGSGKSHMATATARKHPGARVLRPYDLTRMMREEMRHDGNEADAVTRVLAVPVLVLDDLGSEKLTEFGAQALFELIDGWWMAARGGLIVTSNLSLDRLAEKIGDARAVSRLAGICEVHGLSTIPDNRLAR